MSYPVLTNSSISTTAINIAAPVYISNPAITTWTVERGTTNGLWTSTTTTATLPITDTTVSAGTTYYYKLTGTNGQLTSSSVSGTAITTYAVPTAPSGFTVNASAYNTVYLNWTASTTNNAANPVIDYKIERATDSGFTTNLVTVSSTVTGVSYTDVTTSQLTTYYYRVSARNGLGYSSASATASGTTPVQPIYTTITASATTATYPSLVTISGTVSPVPTGGSVGVAWTSSSPTSTSVNTTTGAWSIPNIGFPGTNNGFQATYTGYNAYQTSSTNGSYVLNQGQPVITQNLVDGSNVSSYIFNVGSTMYYKASLALPTTNTPLSGETIRFEAYNSTSATWESIGSATTDVNGAVQIPWTPTTVVYTYIRGVYDGSVYYQAYTSNSYSITIRNKYTATYSSGGSGSVGTLTLSSGQELASTFVVPIVNGAVNYTVDSMTLSIAGSSSSVTVKPSIWTNDTIGSVLYQGGSSSVASSASPVVKTFTGVNLPVTAGSTYYVGLWRSTASMLYSYGAVANSTTVYDDSASTAGVLNHDRTSTGRGINYTVTYSYYK
jgi:hypothetical protein